jgi:hypothetical protein
MRVRINGGVIGPTNLTTQGTASGIYSIVEAQIDRQNNLWPTYSTYSSDQYFNRTSLLLHGDGSINANNNTILDSSPQATTLTRAGTTTQGSFSPYSQVGWSSYISGGSKYVTLPSQATGSASPFSFNTGDFTIECWVYINSLTVERNIIDTVNSGDAVGTGRYGLGITTAGVIRFYTGAGTNILTGATLSPATWYHIAVTRSSSVLRIFVDGSQVASSSDTTSYVVGNTNRPILGINGFDASSNPMDGYISNLRIIKGNALYTGTFIPSTIPLTAVSGTSLLTFQDNRFKDNSTNSWTLTTSGNPGIQPISPFAPTVAYGVSAVGGSITAITASDSVTGTMNGSPGTGDFSIEFWLYPTSYASATNVVPFALGASNAAGSLSIFFSTTSTQTVFRYGAGGSGNDYTIGSVPALNTWTHYALCRNSGTTTVYVNGVVVTNTGTAISGTPTITATAMSMFALSGLSQYLGYMTGVRYITGSSAYTGPFNLPTAPVSSSGTTLLLLNGTNGSIYDSTTRNNLVTSSGGGRIDTTQSKFGGSSIRLQGGVNMITTAGPQNSLGIGNYTVEMWIYLDGAGVQRPMGQGALGTGEFLFIIYGDGSFDWCESVTARVNPGSGAVPPTTWTHIAIVRSGLTTSVYINGTQTGSTYTPVSNYNYSSTNPIYIGAGGSGATGGQTFAGYIDDLRITPGAARYTSNFSVPSTAFPNL